MNPAAYSFRQYGQHPYVSYASGYDPAGQLWIFCQCGRCGDRWQKPCNHAERVGYWVGHYAIQHSHGLRPVR